MSCSSCAADLCCNKNQEYCYDCASDIFYKALLRHSKIDIKLEAGRRASLSENYPFKWYECPVVLKYLTESYYTLAKSEILSIAHSFLISFSGFGSWYRDNCMPKK